jgi:hypothetical protein
MIHNTIEFPVELPGDNIFRPLEPEIFTGHQAMERICGKIVRKVVNSNNLVAVAVPGDGKQFVPFVFAIKIPIEAIFIMHHSQ